MINRLSGIIKKLTYMFLDGLTVPFALAAGLASLGSSQIVIYGGAAGNK